MFSLNNKAMDRGMISIVGGRVVVTPTADGTVWMSQHEIARLLGCFVSAVGANVRAILKSEVLREEEVCRTYRYRDGGSVEQYNLEMIIALAFRIRSRNAEVFRRWLMERVMKRPDKQIPVFLPWNDKMIPN